MTTQPIHWFCYGSEKNTEGRNPLGTFVLVLEGVLFDSFFSFLQCRTGHGKWYMLLWPLLWGQESPGWLQSAQPTYKASRHFCWVGSQLLTAAALSEKSGMSRVEDMVPSRTRDGYQGALSSTALAAQRLHGPSLHFLETTISYINVLQSYQDHRNRKVMISKYKIISD